MKNYTILLFSGGFGKIYCKALLLIPWQRCACKRNTMPPPPKQHHLYNPCHNKMKAFSFDNKTLNLALDINLRIYVPRRNVDKVPWQIIPPYYKS